MKVKILREIPIGGHKYKIQFVPNLLRDEGNRGQLTWHREVIELAPNMPYNNLVNSFIHECIHAIDRGFCGDHITEDQVLGLAEGLLQILNSLGIEFDWSNI